MRAIGSLAGKGLRVKTLGPAGNVNVVSALILQSGATLPRREG
jgi:hypothetical protein